MSASHPARRVAVVVWAHLVIDWLSAVVIPILSVLEARVDMPPQRGAILVAVGSIASGVIQPLVALVSDKFDTRWAGTAGLVAAAFAMGCVGYARTFEHLLILQIIGTAGIGAFHPIGAAAAGHLAGRRRATTISVFYAFGLAGGVSGSFSIPWLADHFDLRVLAWTLVPSLLTAALLAWAIHGVAHRHHRAHELHAALPPHVQRRRWVDVALLYVANALRFVVNMMLAYLLVRWCEQQVLAREGATLLDDALRTRASRMNGPLQGSMAIGMGVSGLLLGYLAPVRLAKPLLTLVPLVGVVAIPAFARSEHPALASLLAGLMGLGYSAVMPLTITLAQRLLPHRTSLASALMMGGAWALAAVGPPGVQALLAQGVTLVQCFDLAAALLFLSALLALFLGPVPDDHH